MSKDLKDTLFVTLFLSLLAMVSSVSLIAGFTVIILWTAWHFFVAAYNRFVDRYNARIANGEYKRKMMREGTQVYKIEAKTEQGKTELFQLRGIELWHHKVTIGKGIEEKIIFRFSDSNNF